MAKTTVEFSDNLTSVLSRLAGDLSTTKVDVIRSAMELYSFVVDEMKRSQGDVTLGLVTDKNEVKTRIAVPGLTQVHAPEKSRLAVR
jgi:predicted transcriptional regulator